MDTSSKAMMIASPIVIGKVVIMSLSGCGGWGCARPAPPAISRGGYHQHMPLRFGDTLAIHPADPQKPYAFVRLRT